MAAAHVPPADANELFQELVSDIPYVDLSIPAPTLTGEPPPSEPTEQEDPSDESTPSRKRPLSPTQRRRDHHNTHTRRCRARLNWRFDALHAMLPTPLGADVPRHKVHVLDHAISALTSLSAENERLRLQVAIRSPAAIVRWVDDVVPSTGGGSEALVSVLELLCFEGRWCYAEIWGMCEGGMRAERTVVKCSGALETGFGAVRRHVEGGFVVEMDMEFAGRAFLHGCAQWERNCVGACADATRAQMLASVRVRTGLAVPVPVDGENCYVVALYDVRDRKEDSKVVDFATFVASAFGNCMGARRFGSAVERSSCRVRLKTEGD